MTTWQTIDRISLYLLLPKHFVRIHRSTIINLEFVERRERSLNYSYDVYMRGVD